MKNAKFEVYQIAPEKNSLMECFVIRTENNKIIVIDGGRDGEGKLCRPYLPSAIRAILGLGQDGFFEVEAWFLSHAHTDHIYELAKMLESYTPESNFRIKNLYFDFPPIENGWSSKGGAGDYSLKELDALRSGLDNYAKINGLDDFDYHSLNGAVINSESVKNGLHITIDGCDFEVLGTWCYDDLIINSNSVVLRMTCGGHSFLFLGDAYIDTGDRLLASHGAEKLRSDYVQLSHHGQHGCSKEFYLAIGADKSVRLWPSPVWVWGVYKHAAIVCDQTRSWFGLPEKPEDYFAAGCDKTGKDIVAGLYNAYPAEPSEVAAWTEDILREQRVL